MEDPDQVAALFDGGRGGVRAPRLLRRERGREQLQADRAAGAAPPRPLLRDEHPRLRARRAAGGAADARRRADRRRCRATARCAPSPTYANLGAAKAALEAWVRYMAVEFGPRGINVNAVNGGVIESDSSAYFYGVEGMPALETRPVEDPEAADGDGPGDRRRGRLPARTALGVHHRADARRGRRASAWSRRPSTPTPTRRCGCPSARTRRRVRAEPAMPDAPQALPHVFRAGGDRRPASCPTGS